MKEMELRKHATCSLCGEKIMAAGVPLFWRVKIERFGVKLDAVQRQQGLAMMMGGNSMLAHMLSADEEMTVDMMKPVTLTVCENCAMSSNHCVASMAEKARHE